MSETNINVLVISAAICAIAILSCFQSDDPVRAVKSGEKALYCNGKHIDKEKVVDIEGDAWLFTNGYARNCTVKTLYK